MRAGRPLRFLAAVLGGWTALRAYALWPTANPVAALIGTAAAATAPVVDPVATPTAPAPPSRAPGAVKSSPPKIPITVLASATSSPALAATATPAHTPSADQATSSAIPPPVAPPPLASPPRRLAVSAWLIARGGANATLLGGQLGASQAGIRATYALGRSRRLALAARLATPLHGTGRELALGVDWQPLHIPLHLIAEQRIALDGGRGGPTAGVIGGIGPKLVAHGVQLEAYGQAGVIARDGGQPFADGAVRLTHPIALPGRFRLDLGLGSWGGAQRGAARLDAGPTVGLVVPVANRAVRLTADWRQRIAGDARPGSGPALSIGSDF